MNNIISNINQSATNFIKPLGQQLSLLDKKVAVIAIATLALLVISYKVIQTLLSNNTYAEVMTSPKSEEKTELTDDVVLSDQPEITEKNDQKALVPAGAKSKLAKGSLPSTAGFTFPLTPFDLSRVQETFARFIVHPFNSTPFDNEPKREQLALIPYVDPTKV